MTMHGAKGREFDAVAIIDLFDGHVPFYKAEPGDEIEEEGRRLLYVALTRAKKVLMIFTLADPGDRTQPSRFLPAIFPNGPTGHLGLSPR
jgi:DNA helicase-2/ATP-dependent DNA helicase PcrA